MIVKHIVVGPIRTNCYIVADEETRMAAVIDPGDKAEAIVDIINKEKLHVQYIIFTHAHYDHVLGAYGVQKATGAKVVVSEMDANDVPMQQMCRVPQKCYEIFVTPPDIKVKDGDKLNIGSLEAEFIMTPGHTKGSCVVKIGDTLFTGDTLFRGTCGRCDLPGGDIMQMLKSLKKLSELPGDYKVLPGHEDFTTLEEERQTNPYMRQ